MIKPNSNYFVPKQRCSLRRFILFRYSRPRGTEFLFRISHERRRKAGLPTGIHNLEQQNRRTAHVTSCHAAIISASRTTAPNRGILLANVSLLLQPEPQSQLLPCIMCFKRSHRSSPSTILRRVLGIVTRIRREGR